MNLQSVRELEVTREKLKGLEDLYRTTQSKPSENAHVKELTLRSIKRHINQLTEEIVRFNARATVRP